MKLSDVAWINPLNEQPHLGQWKENTYYRVCVMLTPSNFKHEALLFTGYLEDGFPSTDACIMNPTYDENHLLDGEVRLRVIQMLHTESDVEDDVEEMEVEEMEVEVRKVWPTPLVPLTDEQKTTLKLDTGMVSAIQLWYEKGLSPGACVDHLLKGDYEGAFERAHELIKPHFSDIITYVESLPLEGRGEKMDDFKGGIQLFK
ncbi:hypothetical protein [Neptuniibacter sp. QD37_11]|uniref:hypothetical protein n=1 Tax=Neptuniibacter sp. QD37_11 TaxID=3398209 RepID=UPI0039F609E2